MKKVLKVIALSMVLFVGGAFVLPAQMVSLDSYAAAKPKISKKKATIIKGKSIRLKVKNRNGKKVRWSSTKRKVATVKKGKVVAKKKGKATIIAKVGKKKLRCRVTVKNPTTRLNKTRITLTLGQTYKLTAKSNGKSKKVRWKSNNSNVASVYKGTVTAKRGGTARITATMNGVSKTCTVTVRPYRTYNAGMYRVGSTIPAGEYYIYSTNDYGAYFEISTNSSGSLDSIVANDNFNYNSIIQVTSGQYLTLERCYAIPAGYASVSTNGEGMFKVGKDISAGEYQVIAMDSIGGYYEISSDASHVMDKIIKNDFFTGNRYITLQNGQYLKLSNAKIVR